MASETSETQPISSWSGKARPRKPHAGRSYKGTRVNESTNVSPKIGALDPQSLKEEVSPQTMGPKTPNIVITPKSAHRSEKSLETSSSDGASSIRSAATDQSQTPRRPSTTSIHDGRARVTGGGSSDTGSSSPGILHITGLLRAMHSAKAAEVCQVLQECKVRPQERAFTTMIKDCNQDVPKAMQLWEAMTTSSKLTPNTITYSVLINVCGNAGSWEQAEAIFKEQIVAAEQDPGCKPNTFTYSNLLTALLKARKVGLAMHWYSHMKDSGVAPDPPLFTNVIGASLDAGMDLSSILMLVHDMHRQGMYASDRVNVMLLKFIANECGWGNALELYQCMGMAGAPVTTELALTLMAIFGQAGATLEAAQLLHAFMLQDYSMLEKAEVAFAALETYAKAGRYQRSVQLWQKFFKLHDFADATVARLVLTAIEKAGQTPSMPGLKQELVQAMRTEAKRPGLSSENHRQGAQTARF